MTFTKQTAIEVILVNIDKIDGKVEEKLEEFLGKFMPLLFNNIKELQLPPVIKSKEYEDKWQDVVKDKKSSIHENI